MLLYRNSNTWIETKKGARSNTNNGVWPSADLCGCCSVCPCIAKAMIFHMHHHLVFQLYLKSFYRGINRHRPEPERTRLGQRNCSVCNRSLQRMYKQYPTTFTWYTTTSNFLSKQQEVHKHGRLSLVKYNSIQPPTDDTTDNITALSL